MEGRRRTIEIDEDVAVALEQRAAERSLAVSELMADLLAIDAAAGVEADCLAGKGHWSPSQIASDIEASETFRRERVGVPWDDVKTWMQSWGTADVQPAPKLRKL